MQPEDFKVGETYNLINRKCGTKLKAKLKANPLVTGGAIFIGKDQNKASYQLGILIACNPKMGWEKV